MDKKKIYFVTDCGRSENLGFGHFIRCLSLSKFFKKKYRVFFIETSRNLKKKINKKNLIKLNNIDSVKKGSIAFIDLPKIPKNFEVYKKKFERIIIIDEFNLCKIKEYKKIKIIKSNNIKKILPLKLYKVLLGEKIKKKNTNEKILVSFGGSDFFNLKKQIKKKIISENLHHKYNFVFSKGFSELKAKDSFVEEDMEKIFLKYKVKLFIGAGGNTMFEIVYKKIPSLIFPTNKIELKYFNYLKKISNIKKLNLKLSLKDQIELTLKEKSKKYNIINKKNINQYYKKLINFE
jgi:spore coat polysaccharide biosynthesis predicted glycosyltransferase SpsG